MDFVGHNAFGSSVQRMYCGLQEKFFGVIGWSSHAWGRHVLMPAV